MRLKRSLGLIALVTAMAVLVIVAPALSDTVTERGGSVDRDDEVTGGKDSFEADAVDPVAGTLSKTFHAPDPLTFRDFTDEEKQNQAPESKIDLILSEGWSKDDVEEGAADIEIDLLTNDFESANEFPILADGNLSGGSGGEGGEGGDNPHWAAIISNANIAAKWVPAADVNGSDEGRGDVPFIPMNGSLPESLSGTDEANEVRMAIQVILDSPAPSDTTYTFSYESEDESKALVQSSSSTISVLVEEGEVEGISNSAGTTSSNTVIASGVSLSSDLDDKALIRAELEGASPSAPSAHGIAEVELVRYEFETKFSADTVAPNPQHDGTIKNNN